MFKTNDYYIVEDLARKLSTYERCEITDYDVVDESQISMICSLILSSSLRCGQITRSVVVDLLNGNISWPKEDGTNKSIQTGVNLEELEKTHLVRFVNNKLAVVGKIKPVEGLNARSLALIQAVNDLYDIRWAADGLSKNCLVLKEDQVQAITNSIDSGEGSEEQIEDRYFLHREKDGTFSISLPYEKIKPIGTALWPLLLEKHSEGKDALSSWIHYMTNAFGYPQIFQLRFYNVEHENIFLDAATELILDEPDFNNSWSDEACKLAAEMYPSQIFYVLETKLSLTINDNGSTRTELPTQIVPVDPQSMGQLADKTVNSPENLLSAYKWWRKEVRYRGYSELRGMYHSLLGLIVRKEKLLFDSGDSFKRVQKLLGSCLDRPGVAGALLNRIQTPSLTCFLLRREETATIGMLRIISSQNVPTHPLSSSHDYEMQWRSMVWRESLEIVFRRFEWLPENQFIGAAETIASLLHAVAQSAFSRGENGDIVNGKECLKEALTFLENVKTKEHSNAPPQPLLQNILPLLPDVIAGKVAYTDGDIPYAEWYLLFWCLDRARWHGYRYAGEDGDIKHLCPRISATIVTSYLRVLHDRYNGKGLALDAEVIFNQLNWALLFEYIGPSEKAPFLYALQDFKIDNVSLSEDEHRRKKISAIRLHLRALLAIYSHFENHENSNARELANELVDAYDRFGFTSDRLNGVFYATNDEPKPFGRIYLWEMVCRAANWFDEALFSRFIYNLFKITPPLKCVLTLYKETVSEKRRQQVMEKIVDFDPNTERFTLITEIQDAASLAANNNMPELADKLVTFGRLHAHATFIPTWAELGFKISLLNIFKDTSMSIAERSERLSKQEIPPELSKPLPSSQVKNEFELFRRHLQALLLYETDPLKCYKWLDALCAESSDSNLHANRLAARIKFIDSDVKDADKPLAYKQALAEWNEASRKFPNHKLSLLENGNLLTCYCFSNDTASFNELWSKLASFEQVSLEVVLIRCKFLQLHSSVDEALNYLTLVRSTHSELPEWVEDLNRELLNQETLNTRLSKIYIPLSINRLTVNEAQRYWDEILSRFNDQEHAAVFSSSSLSSDFQLETFIAENIRSIAEELLIRRNNLLRQITNAQKGNSGHESDLEEENIINDWFVSLLEQRMSYLCWKVGDQKRTGKSESGISPGMSDAWVSNLRNGRLFIFECFRLFGLNTTAINKHIDKLASYDSIGCSPSVMVVYCFAPDFKGLCLGYVNHLRLKQYQGFDQIDVSQSEQPFDLIVAKGNLRVYQEKRSINSVPIVIFHFLLSFKE